MSDAEKILAWWDDLVEHVSAEFPLEPQPAPDPALTTPPTPLNGDA